MRGKPNRDSIANEPAFSGNQFEIDPSETTASLDQRTSDASESVWSEPTLRPIVDKLKGEFQTPFEQWLTEGRRRTSTMLQASLLVILPIIGGPLAVITAFYGVGETLVSLLAITIVAPVVEEMGKILSTLFVVEKRPYWFSGSLPIVACCAGSGLVFAILENLIYLNVYIENPSASIIWWRWTVCVALHVTCSAIAGFGVARIWSDLWKRLQPARTELGYGYWVAAMIVHGAYNGTMVLLESTMSLFE